MAVDEHSLTVRKDNIIDKLALYTSTVLFALLIFFSSFNVLVRQLDLDIFQFVVFWTDPISRYILIIMTYLGVAIAYRNNENVKIDIINRALQNRRPGAYTILQITVLIATFAIATATVIGAFTSSLDTWSSSTDMPILTMGMLHLGVGTAFLLLLLYIGIEMKEIVQTMRSASSIQEGFRAVAQGSEASREQLDTDDQSQSHTKADIHKQVGVNKEENADE